MKMQDIYKMMEAFQASELAELEVTHQETTIKLKRNSTSMIQVQPQGVTPQYVEQPSQELTADVKTGTEVLAPLVGIFYEAPSPESAPFVQVGTKVKEGDTLCVIEAMKTMNEICATTDGIITTIYVQNEEVVGVDTPLFCIEEIKNA